MWLFELQRISSTQNTSVKSCDGFHLLLSDLDDFRVEEAHDEDGNVEDKDEDEGNVQFIRGDTLKIACSDSNRRTTAIPFQVGHTSKHHGVNPNHNNHNPHASFGEQLSVGKIETVAENHVPVDRKHEDIGDGGYEENVVHGEIHTTQLYTSAEKQVVGENVKFQWDDEKCH